MTMHQVQRFDSKFWKLGAGFALEACRRDDAYGKGACLSLWLNSDPRLELIRFDAFADRPHVHFNLETHDSPRIEIPWRGDREALFAFGFRFVRENFSTALVLAPLAKVDDLLALAPKLVWPGAADVVEHLLRATK